MSEWAKVNIDGACKWNPGPKGSGGVTRDDCGRWFGGFLFNVGHGTSILAKLWAVYHGHKLALNCRHRQVILEMDSKELVHILRMGVCDINEAANLVFKCVGSIKSGK